MCDKFIVVNLIPMCYAIVLCFSDYMRVTPLHVTVSVIISYRYGIEHRAPAVPNENKVFLFDIGEKLEDEQSILLKTSRPNRRLSQTLLFNPP